MATVKWKGHEVHNPILRAFAISAAVVVGGLFGAGALLYAVIAVVTLTPLHPIFRLCGRKGFFRGNGEFTADSTSFERR